ncbi:MAG: hypothetical protein M1834_005980 [Cirrosporium novae-zelandiae]|nr:MAG: hypothetical protein M1834_005980 [Cirrosporium novae-zelandiae]
MMDFAQFPFLEAAFQQTPRLSSKKALLQIVEDLKEGKYEEILSGPQTREIISSKELSLGDQDPGDFYTRAVGSLLKDAADDCDLHLSRAFNYFCVGLAALEAFLQSNVTGPVLSFNPSDLLIPSVLRTSGQEASTLQKRMIEGLTVDGETAYQLIPHVELLCAARRILNSHEIIDMVPGARWARLRVNFIHQKLLSENTDSLQSLIFDDLKIVGEEVLGIASGYSKDARVQFLLERAAIYTQHGLDKKARKDLEEATMTRRFQYVLTGRLGKRTKFQQKDVSQLVVLAKSWDEATERDRNGKSPAENKENLDQKTKPDNIDLNDDTLLEAISFSKPTASAHELQRDIPRALMSVDPSNQPQLKPLDSIILLSLASSITNTSPEHGLTREETLPYATRVLEGGSSNWQVYTQALLVRSRIEGYRSRTVERGVLQLQALVDQVIAETSFIGSSDPNIEVLPNNADGDAPSTAFLPKPKPSESAPASERLRYVYALSSPTRWDLEAELAARWVNLGGLRTALEIYERLHMWPEAALCYAAVDREDQARRIVRRQLYTASGAGDENDKYEGPELRPLPPNAPRLFCILGDLDHEPSLYERAWEVSNNHYARAQRSVGRHYVTTKQYAKAAEAYRRSLKINRLNASTWFAVGCVYLQLEDWPSAVESFTQSVQIQDDDAEAWSNLAAALLRLPEDFRGTEVLPAPPPLQDEEVEEEKIPDSQTKTKHSNKHSALHALNQASRLAPQNPRITSNLLTVAASVSPPDIATIIVAQSRLIQLSLQGSSKSTTSGSSAEKQIDILILSLVTRTIISQKPYSPESANRGITRMFLRLMDKDVIPVITHSAELWRLVARIQLWRNRPFASLSANENAWRAALAPSGGSNWEDNIVDGDDGRVFEEVARETEELCDAYESLGERQREGMNDGTLVCKEWRFKSRSAVRGVMGRGRERWEGSPAWERLAERLEGLKVER